MQTHRRVVLCRNRGAGVSGRFIVIPHSTYGTHGVKVKNLSPSFDSIGFKCIIPQHIVPEFHGWKCRGSWRWLRRSVVETNRLRFAVSPEMPLNFFLKGEVEVDETFVGGKGFRCSRYRHQTPVVALIERGGDRMGQNKTRCCCSPRLKNPMKISALKTGLSWVWERHNPEFFCHRIRRR